MGVISKMDIKNELVDLVQENNFVGWIYSIN